MIERCPFCGKDHETGGVEYMGVPYKFCPDLPGDAQVPLRNVPIVIYGPNGERFETFRYELAGR